MHDQQEAQGGKSSRGEGRHNRAAGTLEAVHLRKKVANNVGEREEEETTIGDNGRANQGQLEGQRTEFHALSCTNIRNDQDDAGCAQQQIKVAAATSPGHLDGARLSLRFANGFSHYFPQVFLHAMCFFT